MAELSSGSWMRFVPALACAVAAVLGPASAVSAEELVLADRARDVLARPLSEEGDVYDRPTRLTVNVDLRRSIARHTTEAVVVRTRFTELRRINREVVFLVRLQTSTGVRRWAMVTAYRGTVAGVHRLTKADGARTVRCHAMKHTVDYAANKIRLQIPRSCLRDPRWIKVQVLAGSYDQKRERDLIDVAGSSAPTHIPPAVWSQRLRAF